VTGGVKRGGTFAERGWELRECISEGGGIWGAVHLIFDYLPCGAAICQLIANGKYQTSDVYLCVCALMHVCVCVCGIY